MERLITFSTVSAVTILSMALALLIELALLKVVFHFMAHMKDMPNPLPVPSSETRWTNRSITDLRNAGL
jgi:hypothetical protein